MIKSLPGLFVRLALAFALLSAVVPCQAQTTTLGVYAYRDQAQVRQQFEPVAQVIQNALPESDVRLLVLDTQELDSALASSKIDFVLTNPLHFMVIRRSFQVSGPLATLQKTQGRYTLSTTAGVILTRADSNLKTLDQLKGSLIGIPGKRCLNGYLAQAYEIRQQGFDPKQFARYAALGSHDAVMRALLDGRVKAGFVRTGMLED